jgi:ABC-type phosphate/phosphonate transport system substrate-binding protein
MAALARMLGRPIEPFYIASYEELAAWLLDGTLAVAWAPPSVSLRAVVRGANAPLSFVRQGKAAYRGALFGRADRPLSLRESQGLRAAWVAPHSLGGHLLAKLAMRHAGLVPERMLRRERFLGSYQEVFDAVLQGHADLGAAFVPAGGSAPACWAEFSPAAGELRALLLSPAVPNDGFAFSPWLLPEQAAELRALLEGAFASEEGRALLGTMFGAEGMTETPADAYRDVLAAVGSEPERLRSAHR